LSNLADTLTSAYLKVDHFVRSPSRGSSRGASSSRPK
jgi:hypothetical protein